MSDSREIQSNVRFLPDSGRRAYEAEVVNLFRGFARPQLGISDSDRDNEHEAARIFYTSLEHFMGDLERAAALSPLRQSQLHELRDAILDNAPGKKSWEEAISGARRGY